MATTITLTADEYDALLAERARLTQQLRVVTVERDVLKERLDAFLRRLFAAKSEARNAAQGDLFLNEAEALAPAGTPVAEEVEAEGIEIAGHLRKKRGRKPLDPHLPREIVRHELPASERVCAHDGTALVEIGVDISEQLDIIPQQVRVIQHQRVKYACPCCDEGIRVSPAPARIIPKGLLSESALAWVVSAKYQDALPLYRQAALLGRFGGDLSRNTLAASIVRVGEAVQPIINLLRDHLLEADLVLGDETVIQVLKEPGRSAQSKSYLWAQMTGSGPPIRLFAYAPGRGGNQATHLYAGIKAGAVLMSDGYEVYNAIAEANGLTHLGCWAHARRYFVEAEAVIPKAARGPEQPATQFIAAIGELYAIEAKAKDFTPPQRGQLRNEHSRPVLTKIEALLVRHLHRVMPNSLLGKALHYLSAQWPKLIRFVGNGAWPIDNNLCENAIRPFVVGRRNWLFADTVAGANASAHLYSLIETCKANRIDPYTYLVDLFRKLPLATTVDEFEKLLPWHLTQPVAAT
ncbi:IS66 family transposase [Methylocaldum sp.]|uniref:IS66 family transposase n=1 Tax=Methylocaldum sp. TaxID=1969727 RepID=UPI002D5209B7|nr:IS66 family transposase [Methylocaldum sp.]HYE37477.1 IS66 family transposase [Methylocaldum sp.]